MTINLTKIKLFLCNLFDRSRFFCWGMGVAWATGTAKFWECWTGCECKRESQEHKHHICYCGKFRQEAK